MKSKSVVTVIFRILIMTLLFAAQIFVANILPNPFNKINIVMLTMMSVLIFAISDKFFPYLFGLSLLTELFHVTPFGFITASLLIAMFALEWLLVNVLTNRFFMIVFIAGIIGVIAYRLVFIILMYLWRVIADGSFDLNTGALIGFGMEAVINATALTVIYSTASIFVKKLNPRYVIKDY